jgi:transposase
LKGEEEMFYVDIDWADQKHDVCVVDEKGERVVKFTISHTAQGLSELHRLLSMLIPNRDELLLALETDKGLVVSFLLDLGYTVYPINPKVVSRYRDHYRTSDAKSDPLDPLVLA